MTQHPDERELVRQFLLGALDEKRQDKIEERLLTDQRLQEELSAVRDDLIDEYVFGLLDQRELELFEKNFPFPPEHLHQLRLSRALKKFVETDVAEPEAVNNKSIPPWQKPLLFLWQQKFAAALTVIIVLSLVGYGGWRFYRHRQLETLLAQAREQRLKVELDLARLNKEPQLETSPWAGSSLIRLTLKSRFVRDSGDSRRAMISNGADILQLRLQLSEDKFPIYRAVIQTEDGVDMYTVNNLAAIAASEGKVITLTLPSRLLPTGDYRVSLSGNTAEGQAIDVGTYPFQVILK